MIDHLLVGPVKNIVDTALIRNRIIINGIPLNEPFPKTLLRATVITTPILLFLNTFIKIEPNNIKINVLPVPSNE